MYHSPPTFLFVRSIISTFFDKFLSHRCTVVGNPGGGAPWGFLANSFEGGTWGCEKIRGGSFLLHFYVEVFQNLYRGT